MKPLKFNAAFRIFLTIVSAILVAMIWVRTSKRHNASCIQGIVVDVTPDLSEESFAKLEMAGRKHLGKEFSEILQGMYEVSSPVPGAMVSAKSDSVTKKTNTDAKGKFKFTGLPSGDYEVFAEVSSGAKSKQMATLKPVRVYLRGSTLSASVQIPIRSDLVAIRGRIMDVEGRPIVGAKVHGEPFPMPESAEATPPARSAVSGADGTYELSGFAPKSIHQIAGYLVGGDPTRDDAGGYNIPFYVKVYADANGFVQDKTSVPRVPLVAELLCEPARRYLKTLGKWETQPRGSSKFLEKTNVLLPSSLGNTITGIDIVLK